ncbi:MAG: ATP-binding protein, partial [Planctomycetaceae bacterium]
GVINAFRHGGSGPVTLRVSVDDETDQLSFEIEDNGPGFSSHDQRLFEPYWQAAGSEPGRKL